VSRLKECAGASFMGVTKSGPFDIDPSTARKLLVIPNPHGRSNSEVLKPSVNGADIAKRSSDEWILDFGTLELSEAALFDAPFDYAEEHIRPARLQSKTARNRVVWWQFERPRPEMFAAFGRQPRYIATCLVAKHRFFVWLHRLVVPENVVIVVARADDTTLGILQSRFHELWSPRLGTSLEDRPRYTPTTCFETFPFPIGLTPADTAHQRAEALPNGAQIPADLPAATRPHAEAIARAAKRLTDLRNAWLNPPEWTDRVAEVVPLGMDHSPYPDRILAKPGFEKDLAKRTLTNLYNQRPAWLAQAHEALDAAVAAAYGWADYTPAMADDEILRRLLALNLTRAS
jgi:hypothetical protein